MDYVKFTSDCKKFEVCVKPEFLEKNNLTKEDLEKTAWFILISEKGIMPFLHNPTGPALHNKPLNHSLYFINGKPVTDEELEKMKHSINFNDKLDQTLNNK